MNKNRWEPSDWSGNILVQVFGEHGEKDILLKKVTAWAKKEFVTSAISVRALEYIKEAEVWEVSLEVSQK